MADTWRQGESDLFELAPAFSFIGVCPSCGTSNDTSTRTIFLGLHYLSEFECSGCKCLFFKTLPQGHTAVFPITFSSDLRYADFHVKVAGWLTDPLFLAMNSENCQTQIPIERQIFNHHRSVILINCLDTCYGHIFYKVVSILYYLQRYPHAGIVAIMPKSVAWLCPEGLAELWLIDVPVKHMDRRLKGFDQYLHQALSDFTHVSLGTRYLNPDFEKVDFEKILRVPKFDLEQFGNSPFKITFVLREDRYWHAHKLDKLLWKVFLKLRLSSKVKGYFVYKQNKKVNALCKALKAKFPLIQFFATGIGKSGSLDTYIRDNRQDLGAVDPMQNWAPLYAQSHIVIGTHGSHLLIPTALAAGFIEICTEDKICHISEEIAMIRHPKYMHFLGRFVEETCSVRLLYIHVTHMLSEFENIKIKY